MAIASIITLLDLGRRPRQLLQRIENLARAVQGSEFELIIGHAARDLPHDRELARRLEGLTGENCRLVSVRPAAEQGELARLRNVAVREARTGQLLLVDADIFPDLGLFRRLLAALAKGAPLAMAPCIYLTAEGGKHLARGRQADIVASALNFSPDLVLHWALPSSVIALRSADYWATGGFYEGYVGHGYEDLEFMVRLALAKGLVPPSPALMIDRSYRAPLLAEGFRGLLGCLCLGNVLDGNIAFHLYHDKEAADPYYQHRSRNAELFRTRIQTLVGKEDDSTAGEGMPPMIPAFFSECRQRGLDPNAYYALFDARPRHMLRPRPLHSRLWRSLRRHVRLPL